MDEGGLRLAPIFSDGMILQRDEINHIYGKEMLADTVTLDFLDHKYEARVNEAREFSIALPPVAAGGPYSIRITGSSTLTISDILFGDVYILSGQSNMELPIRRVLDVSAEEISQTKEADIRQYLIPASYDFTGPKEYMIESSWNKAEGQDIMGFSAAGFFFARKIREQYNTPVGLILNAVGGSRIEAWMSPKSLEGFGDYKTEIRDFKDMDYFNRFIEEQREAANQWAEDVQKQEPPIFDNKDSHGDSDSINKNSDGSSDSINCRNSHDSSDNFSKASGGMTGFKSNGIWATCRVPSLVSDYTTETFCGSVYLLKELTLDFEPSGRDSYIYMGSIIDSDQVWINGQLVGRTEYRYPPRKYPIPRGVLRKGNNQILVRILINENNGGTIKGKPYYLYTDEQKISLEGEWYYRVGKKVETPMPAVLFPPRLATGLYHTAVVPLAKMAVKGVLWYQGESNKDRPEAYSDKFAAMVEEWRRLFGWEIPFIYVQLANYREPLNVLEDTGWAELRDQQRRCIDLNNVAMVTAIDLGESNDLHPQNKKALGVRLAKAAEYLIYHEKVNYSGPLPMKAEGIENSIRIEFEHLEDTSTEYNLNNFELSGRDGIYYPAKAIRKGSSVYISSKQVEDPISVRFAWCDDPTDINFYNDAGLPAPGFRLEL